MKITCFNNRRAPSKSLIKLSKIYDWDFHQIQGICAHNTRLDCNKESQFSHIDFWIGHFLDTVDLTMPTRIFVFISQVVTGSLNVAMRINKDASNWYLILISGFDGLF